MRSGSSRKPKSVKGSSTPAPQLDQIQPLYYTDDESALEAGTELEDKAERFAIGWKARKYFEKALGFYQRASHLNSKSQDAPYNGARVLFLLATDFFVPPKSVEALEESARLYRQSLSLASPIEASDGLPSAFFLDVQFNLAVTLIALADHLEAEKQDSNSRINLIDEAITHFNSVIDGQELVLHRQKMEEEIVEDRQTVEQTDNDHDDDYDDGFSQAKMDTDEDKLERSEYTTSLITPASALETLYNLHISAMAVLDTAMDEKTVQRALQLSNNSLQRAQAIFSAFPDGDKRSPDDEWNENISALRFAPLEIKISILAKKNMLGISKGADEETQIMREASLEAKDLLSMPEQDVDLSSTINRNKHRLHSQRLEQMANLLLTLARSHLLQMNNTTTTTTQEQFRIQSIWNLLGQSSKLFLATLKSIDTSAAGAAGSSVVLGVSNASTAMTRRRCSLYTSMSALSIIRSNAMFLQTIAGIDDKTRLQLINNARIYGRKAITEIGLGWLLLKSNSDSKPMYILPHGGLESLQGEIDAVLILLRSLYIRSNIMNLPDNLEEVQTICANVRSFLLNGEHGSAWKRGLFYPGTPEQEGKQLLELVLGEEGEVTVTQEERQYWAQVEILLLQ